MVLEMEGRVLRVISCCTMSNKMCILSLLCFIYQGAFGLCDYGHITIASSHVNTRQTMEENMTNNVRSGWSWSHCSNVLGLEIRIPVLPCG
jgi:hypothetical protein